MQRTANVKSAIIESDFRNLTFPNTNVWNFIYPHLLKYRKYTAVVCPRTLRSYTYEALVELSLRWAKELKKYSKNGVPPTLGILCPNNPEYGIMVLGGFAAGARVCPINIKLNPNKILFMLRLVNASVIVIDESVYKKYQNVVTFLKDKAKVFVRSEQSTWPIEEDFFQALFSKSDLLDLKSATSVDPESVAIVTFTRNPVSRKPKGIFIQHKNYVKSSFACCHEAFFPLPSTTEQLQVTIFGNLCYSHLHELQYYVTVAPVSGCRIVMFENDNWKDYFTYLQVYKPFLLFLTHYAMEALSKEDIPSQAFQSVKIICNVASSHSPNTVQIFKKTIEGKFIIQDHYGKTELMAVLMTPLLNSRRNGRCLRLLPGCKAFVSDIDSGEPITKPFEDGEFYVFSPWIARDYVNKDDGHIDDSDDKDGCWFRTGDAAFFDDDNFFCCKDRVKDVIQVLGKKVFPSSIENILKKHEDIIEAGVIGIPDDETNEEAPKAFIVTRKPLDKEEILAFVQQTTSPEMWLRGGVAFVEKLPRNYKGKLMRKYLGSLSV